MIDTTWTQQAAALRNSFYATDAALRADQRYTDETRLALRCRLLVDTRKQLAALQPQHEETMAAQRRELQRGVFSHPDDPESYRLALDGVAQLDSPALARRLRLAERTGDEVTAAAVMTVAAERSDGSDVVARYLSGRPDKAEQYGRLKDHESQAASTWQDRLVSPWRVSVPSDLPKGNNGAIERLAASVEPEPAPGPPFRIGVPG